MLCDPGTARKGFRSRSSRPQLCSAIMRCPILASFGILAIQAFNVSSPAPAAIFGSMVESDPGAWVADGESAAWDETATNEAANRRSTAQNIRLLSRVVFIVPSSCDRNIAKIPVLWSADDSAHLLSQATVSSETYSQSGQNRTACKQSRERMATCGAAMSRDPRTSDPCGASGGLVVGEDIKVGAAHMHPCRVAQFAELIHEETYTGVRSADHLGERGGS